MSSLILRLLCASVLLICAQGYASYFASNAYCSVTLAEGETIMGASVQTGNSRTIVVKRNGVTLSSGASYVAGESLTVSISSSDTEYAIQVASGDATFSGGACSQKRISNGGGTLTMPSSGAVTLNGGSASSQGTVRMTADFVLNCCQSSAPTRKPTIAPSSRSPSRVPTVGPSLLPSVTPSEVPSVMPSVSGAPVTQTPTSVGTPTVSPSIKPSPAPTTSPTTSQPSNPPVVPPSEVPTEVPSAGPTYLTKTLLTYGVSQVLYNVSVDTLQDNEDASAALVTAMTSSLELFQDPQEVTLTSVAGYEVSEDSSFASRRLTSTDSAVLVTYAVTYLLEDTEYTTAAALQDALTITANLILNSNMFLNYLTAQNVPELRVVTSSSANSLSLVSTVIEQSVAPTHGPTNSPYETDDKFYNGELADKIVVGVLVGLFGVVFSVGMLSYYVKNHVAILAKGSSYTTLPAIFAISSALIALILVSVWATKQRDNDMQYLGVPDWKSNVFAWHPVLMVAGMFFCQVVAISDWVFFKTKQFGKSVHVFFQTAGLASMIAALCAVVKYKLDQNTPNVNSMHAWIGVGAVIAFCCNYIFGFGMGLLTAIAPDSPIHKAYPVLFIHRVLGLTSLGMTTIAIIAGIMNQLPQGACFYDVNSPFQADFDPAENYPYVRGSCQIAHGLGIAVIVAAVFCVLAVTLREKFKGRSRFVNIPDQRMATGDAGVEGKSHVVEFFY